MQPAGRLAGGPWPGEGWEETVLNIFVVSADDMLNDRIETSMGKLNVLAYRDHPLLLLAYKFKACNVAIVVLFKRVACPVH